MKEEVEPDHPDAMTNKVAQVRVTRRWLLGCNLFVFFSLGVRGIRAVGYERVRSDCCVTVTALELGTARIAKKKYLHVRRLIQPKKKGDRRNPRRAERNNPTAAVTVADHNNVE